MNRFNFDYDQTCLRCAKARAEQWGLISASDRQLGLILSFMKQMDKTAGDIKLPLENQQASLSKTRANEIIAQLAEEFAYGGVSA